MKRKLVKELKEYINEKIVIQGWIYKVRKLKNITFIIIRDRSGLVQCIIENSKLDVNSLSIESVVSITGLVKEANNKLNPFEVEIEFLEVISKVNCELPIEINKENLEVNLDTMLNNRYLSLRHEKVNSIFKVQNLITDAFREFLNKEGFTEINTPKIVKEGAEGGSEVFEVKYFEEKAYLAQSPQFYKQMMVGAGFERVFEIGHAYRAEEHSTNRHLNEYISLDLELGFIENEFEIMAMEEKLLKFIIRYLKENGTHSFDLLFRGIEITTGGQRIHNYEELIENMKYKGVNPSNYKSYLEVFKYGMPKHGGLAIGLERITAKLLGLENVREATLITRDKKRLVP